MVGFQTNLKWSEQKRIFRMIPGLEKAEFVRYGVMHRNTFLESPKLLLPTLQFLKRETLFAAGQIAGTEGYAAAAAGGLLAGINASLLVKNKSPVLGFKMDHMFPIASRSPFAFRLSEYLPIPEWSIDEIDTTTSKQLSMTSNSRASRGVSSPPTPSHTNLFIDNGNKSTEQILSEVNNGFYVTDLIGQGVNLITGDYSRGASGFKIENGKISFPINEVTIADNLNNMFKKILISNDLEFLYSINSPTLAIEGMTIAGV